MKTVEGHQWSRTKQDVTVFTESAAVRVGYILLHLNASSCHNHAMGRRIEDSFTSQALNPTAANSAKPRREVGFLQIVSGLQ